MVSRIVKAIVDEYRGKPLGFDELKRVIRVALNVMGFEWTERDFMDIIDGVMYELHEV